MSNTETRGIGNGLKIRWATAEDRPGIALCAAATWGHAEGFEDAGNVRLAERMCFKEFLDLTKTRWAVCVSTEGPRDYTGAARTARDGLTDEQDPYLQALRREADVSPEPVVALIHYWPMDWKIEGESVKVVKTALVACRPEHRASALAVDPTQFGKSVMSRLWEMYFEKMKEDGAALSTICGVPNYYGRYGFEQAIRYGCGFTSDAASCSHASDDPYILRRAVPSDVPRLLEMWPSNRVNNAIWVDIHPDQLEQHFMWVTGTRREPFSSPHDRVGPGYVLECDGTAVAAAFTSKFPEVGEPSLSRLVIGALLYADETDLPSAARALVSALFGPVGTQAVEEELRWRATEDHVAEPNGPAGMTGSVAQIHWALSEHHPFALAMVDAGVATAEPDLTSYSPYTDWLVGIPSLPLFCQALKPVLAKRILRARMSSAIDVGKGALLRVSTFSSYADGVQLKVDEAGNIEVTPLRYSKAELQMAPHAPGMGALPHVVGPTGPLTQLLMGYASWSELRKVHRDLCAARRSLPLLEILFPRATTITMHTFG